MLLDLNSAGGQRHNGSLGSLPPDEDVESKPSSTLPSASGGQFDDADSELEDDNHFLASDINIVSRTSVVRRVSDENDHPSLANTSTSSSTTSTSTTTTSKVMEANKAKAPTSEPHPLQWLVNVACGQSEMNQQTDAKKQPTPKRVSISPGRNKSASELVGNKQLFPEATSQGRTTAIRKEGSSYFEESHHAAARYSSQQMDHENDPKARKTFHERYQELLQFKHQFGHADVLTSGEYKGLGRWLSSLRCKCRSGELPSDQLKLLQELGCIGFDPSEPIPEDVVMTTNRSRSTDNKPPHSVSEIAPETESEAFKPNTYSSTYSSSVNVPYHETREYAPEPRTEYVHVVHHAPPPPPLPHSHRHHGMPGAFPHPQGRMSSYGRFAPPHPVVHKPMRRVPLAPISARQHRQQSEQKKKNEKEEWELRMNQLKEFRKEHGHCNVSTTAEYTKKKEHQELSLWLAQQRVLHRKGHLCLERSKILDSDFRCPGFEPELAPPVVHSINGTIPEEEPTYHHHHHPHNIHQHGHSYVGHEVVHHHPYVQHEVPYANQPQQQVVSHVIRHVGARVPVGEARPKPSMAPQPSRRRGQYVGWHDRLAHLEEFRRRHGHCDVRIMMHDDSKDLGRWLASQRHQYRKGKLPADKAEILHRMGVNLNQKKVQSTF